MEQAVTDASELRERIARNPAENTPSNQRQLRTFEETQQKLAQDIRLQQNHLAKAQGALWKQGWKQMGQEFLKGAAKGIGPGALVGSFLPGGTIVGAVGGGVLAGLRESFMQYSGTTNRHTADGHAPHGKFESSYKEPTGGGHEEHHEEAHDDSHAADAGHGGH
jgi:hypothetical protein